MVHCTLYVFPALASGRCTGLSNPHWMPSSSPSNREAPPCFLPGPSRGARTGDEPLFLNPVEWILLTSLVCTTCEQAWQWAEWYRARWRIEVVGQALFKFSNNPALNFPVAQNTHAYQDAHKELYSYVIDGLDKQTIERIAAHQNLTLNLNSDNTVKALKRALPLLPPNPILWSALDKVSDERRLAGHKVRPKAKRFQAFVEFTKDLEVVVVGLRELLATLENVLGMDSERTCKRQSAKKWLPRIDHPPEAHYAITKLPAIIGKTVERVEFGFREHHDGAHQSEAMILYFTDGSILGIDTGSNAGNIASEYEGLRPDDFHADFILYWVPPPQ